MQVRNHVLSAFVGAVLALVSATANAQEPGSWRGFYVGVHGGYAWGQNDFGLVVNPIPLQTIGNIGSKGSVFGGQAGHNWQSGLIVGGLEMDFSASSLKGDSNPFIEDFGGFTTTDQISESVKYLGSARARLGFTLTGASNWLFYGTAGLGWERIERVESSVLTAPGVYQAAIRRTPEDRFGWVAGLGTEANLGGSNWIARIEYLHYDFGAIEQTFTVVVTPGPAGFSDDAGRQTIDVVRAALSYKFN